MKSHSNQPTNSGPDVSFIRSTFLGNRAIETVRRYAVMWWWEGVRFVLIGPYDFANDLANALYRIMGDDDPALCVSFVTIEPCTQETHKSVYFDAIRTIRYFKEDAQRDLWNIELSEFDGFIPDNWTLTELNQQGKRR